MADQVETTTPLTDGRPAVRRLAVARFASTGGSQAAQVALAYTVFERTHSAAWVSAALVACAGIVGVVGPISGRLSDRFDRRRVMVIAEVGGAIGWLAVLLVDAPDRPRRHRAVRHGRERTVPGRGQRLRAEPRLPLTGCRGPTVRWPPP